MQAKLTSNGIKTYSYLCDECRCRRGRVYLLTAMHRIGVLVPLRPLAHPRRRLLWGCTKPYTKRKRSSNIIKNWDAVAAEQDRHNNNQPFYIEMDNSTFPDLTELHEILKIEHLLYC